MDYPYVHTHENHHLLTALRQWQTSQENIARAEAVIKTITDLFKDKADTVSVIAPVNEYVA